MSEMLLKMLAKSGPVLGPIVVRKGIVKLQLMLAFGDSLLF